MKKRLTSLFLCVAILSAPAIFAEEDATWDSSSAEETTIDTEAPAPTAVEDSTVSSFDDE